MKTHFLSFVLVLLVVLISSCVLVDGVDNDCKSCQDAIDHMAEKISSNNCNPIIMENAWDGIKEDCGALANLYVGYMAEKCNENIDFTTDCDSRGFLSSSGLKLSYNYIGGIDSVYIIVNVPHLGMKSERITIKANDTREKKYVSLNVPEGEDVEIIVLDPSNDDELASATQVFTFERDQIWWKTRVVNISYNTDEQKYNIDFEDW